MRRSIWWEGEGGPPAFLPLSEDREVDVVVVGAGITGLTAALFLARGKRKVLLLEGAHVGAGSTGATSAHLTTETDTDLDQLRRRVGPDAACAAVRANRTGLERIASLDGQMGHRSGFTRVPGYLFGQEDDEVQRIERIAALYTECGERAVAPIDVPLPGSFRGMRLEDQALFHPVRYLAGLVDLAVRAGVELHEQSEVVDWDGGRPARVVLRQGPTVRAEHVVFATHTPPGLVASVHSRMLPYLTFLLVARTTRPVGQGLFWDMEDPYHYVRRLPDGELLVGGADVRPGDGDPVEASLALEEWAGRVLGTDTPTARWSHMWFEPADGLPYVGPLPARTGVWMATGLSGTGLTWGTFAGERLARRILGEEHADDRHFSPARLQLLGSADRVLEETASVFKHLVADRLRPGEAFRPHDLAVGEGRIVSLEGRKVGVCRDETGELHAVSLTCRHMGCQVGWNALDHTWDCACHGGRYRADGTRFWGPPMGDLEKREVGEVPSATPRRTA